MSSGKAGQILESQASVVVRHRKGPPAIDISSGEIEEAYLVGVYKPIPAVAGVNVHVLVNFYVLRIPSRDLNVSLEPSLTLSRRSESATRKNKTHHG